MVFSTRTLNFKEQLMEMGSARNRSRWPFSVVKIQLFLEIHIVCHLIGEAFLHFPSVMCLSPAVLAGLNEMIHT